MLLVKSDYFSSEVLPLLLWLNLVCCVKDMGAIGWEEFNINFFFYLFATISPQHFAGSDVSSVLKGMSTQ